MTNSNIIIYGVNWCWDSRRACRFLERRNIQFEFINIDTDEDAEKFVVEVNHGLRSVPTILFPDGSILVEPSNKEIADKLQLS